MTGALDIPELKLHVATYLNLTNLKACVRVCRAWYQDLQPLVWMRFNVDGCRLREKQRKLRGARLESLRKHAHWIKHIVHRGRLAVVDRAATYTILAEQCRSLESIDMTVLDKFEWELYSKLVEHNRGLCQITIPDLSMSTGMPLDCQPVSLLVDHAHLRQLAVDCSTDLLTILRILEACPSIEQLVVGRKKGAFQQLDPCGVRLSEANIMDDTTTNRPDAAMAPLSLTHLKLEIRCNDPALGTLLKRCPLLEELQLELVTDEVCAGVCDVLAKHRLPLLTSLSLRGYLVQRDQQLAILQAVPPHQLRQVALLPVSLNASGTTTNNTATTLMTDGGGSGDDDGDDGIQVDNVVRVLIDRQHQHLEVLQLTLVEAYVAPLPEIFATCSRLKRLRLDMARALDIRHLLGQPWVCTDLEALAMKVSLDRRPPSTSTSGAGNGGNECSHPHLLTLDRVARTEEDQGLDEMLAVSPGRKEWERVEAAFMKQLGMLTRLQQLQLEPSSSSVAVAAGQDLTFTLANGLGYLAGLTRLEEMVICDRSYCQDVHGLQFMKDHWRRLKRLTFYSIRPKAKRWLQLRWPHLKVVDMKSL